MNHGTDGQTPSGNNKLKRAPARPQAAARSKAAAAAAAALSLAALLAPMVPPAAHAHHFKGLPHYNYFENYPQVPEEEFLGQAGDYEVSLVVYDFQGIDRKNVEDPDNVRLFLVIFNLRDNRVYGGPVSLEILDRGEVLHAERQASSELENLYSLHHQLPDSGRYSLRLTLHDEGGLSCTIPFRLSSQVVHWGKWTALALALLVAVAAVGARRARVKQDRAEEAKKRRRQAQGRGGEAAPAKV